MAYVIYAGVVICMMHFGDAHPDSLMQPFKYICHLNQRCIDELHLSRVLTVLPFACLALLSANACKTYSIYLAPNGGTERTRERARKSEFLFIVVVAFTFRFILKRFVSSIAFYILYITEFTRRFQ